LSESASDKPVAVVGDTPPVPLPLARSCANCGATLDGEFCSACGQRDEPHVHSVGHFFSEAFESITHADSRLWRTLWFLLARPGLLTQQFFAGRRARYLPPFRLYLVISLTFFLVAGLPGSGAVEVDIEPTAERIQGMNEVAEALEGDLAGTPGAAQAAAAIREQAAQEQAAQQRAATDQSDATPPDPGKELQEGLRENNALTEFCKEFAKPDTEANRNYARLHAFCNRTAEDRGRALFDAIVHNIPRAMFVFLPLLALVMKLLYWRPKRYYVEHLLLLVHNHAFVFLAFTLIGLLELIPVVGGHLGLLKLAAWLYTVWYIYKSLRVYYAQPRGLTIAKFLTIGFAYFATTVLVLVLTAVFSALTL
jgi:hypothetical protein